MPVLVGCAKLIVGISILCIDKEQQMFKKIIIRVMVVAVTARWRHRYHSSSSVSMY